MVRSIGDYYEIVFNRWVTATPTDYLILAITVVLLGWVVSRMTSR